MNAIELADTLEQQFPLGTAQHFLVGDAAAMLRRQHEVIQKLREALQSCIGVISPIYYAHRDAEQALKDTEGL